MVLYGIILKYGMIDMKFTDEEKLMLVAELEPFMEAINDAGERYGRAAMDEEDSEGAAFMDLDWAKSQFWEKLGEFVEKIIEGRKC